MDLVTLASRFALPGETLMADRFLTVPGGKGANQAVAAARLGAQVALVGALGDDGFGEQLRHGLIAEGIDIEHVHSVPDCGSGTASITVAQGDNHILVVPAANARLTPAHVERAATLIGRSDAVLVQMEVPLETVEATVRLAHRLGVPVILNPAPAQPLPVDWLKLVRCITPNQHELSIVLDAANSGDEADDFQSLMQRLPCPVVVTRGADGAWFRETGKPIHQPGYPVEVIDTTGAGDTFNAALAVFLHEGMAAAVRKACAAAALSVARLGAQGGMPRLADVEALLGERA
ncbi:MAG: hypothetical protein WDW38_006543 [Sanguina aurantia]